VLAKLKKLLGIKPKKFIIVKFDNESDGVKKMQRCIELDKIRILEETETTYLLERPIDSYLNSRFNERNWNFQKRYKFSLYPQRVIKNHPAIAEIVTEE